MSWEAIGAIGEVISAIAVVATLIYLAVQVRETGKSQALNASQLNRNVRIEWFSGMRDSPYLPAIREKIELGG